MRKIVECKQTRCRRLSSCHVGIIDCPVFAFRIRFGTFTIESSFPSESRLVSADAQGDSDRICTRFLPEHFKRVRRKVLRLAFGRLCRSWWFTVRSRSFWGECGLHHRFVKTARANAWRKGGRPILPCVPENLYKYSTGLCLRTRMQGK